MEKPTPAFYLFHHYQTWLVPEYMCYSDYDINVYGIVAHPEAKKAAAIMSNPVPVTKRPFEVAAYLAQTGGYLAISNPKKAIEVYDNIMRHLANWLQYLEIPQFMTREIPMQGLREFNLLANRLFPVAFSNGYFQKPTISHSDMLQAMWSGRPITATQPTHSFNDTIMKRIELAYRRRR